MAIGNAVQKGSLVYVYDEKGNNYILRGQGQAQKMG